MPSELNMEFFTPELYRRFNAEDDQTALAADAEWEAAISSYHRHLHGFQDKMPSPVLELSKLCLHDGEILERKEQQNPLFEDWPGSPFPLPLWYGLATVAVRLDNEVVALFYFLSDHITERPAAKDWPFSKKREHWLYDEVHWQGSDRGPFTHRILLSTGILLVIPFTSVSISRFPLSPASGKSGRQSA